MLNKHENNIDY